MEKKISVIPAIVVVFIQIAMVAYCIYSVHQNWPQVEEISTWIVPGLMFIIVLVLASGFIVLQPNEAAVISFMGKYKGTLKDNGFLFKNPFYGSTTWSLKVSNFETPVLEVNDKNGVPIEIAAIVVWKVGDTYKAEYDVEDLNDYIDKQFEVSLRKLAKNHTYAELSGEDKDFLDDLTETASKAGVIILDAKITHLNYSAEMAPVMLLKQQANAMKDAKEIIVENAIAIARDAAKEITELSGEQKGRFISDLIIVLCSDRGVTPVVSVSN